jgi:hypothetical protein
MLKQEKFFLGARQRRFGPDPAVQHERSQDHVPDHGAGDGDLEDPVPAVTLELADVVQKDPGEDQIGVRAGIETGGGLTDVGDLAGVLEQAAQGSVMPAGTRRALLVAVAEGAVVVEEAEDSSEPGRRPRPTASGCANRPVRAATHEWSPPRAGGGPDRGRRFR